MLLLLVCLCSYMTFAIGAVAETFAVLVVAPSVDRIGRHNIVAIGNLLGGAACLACANVAGGTTQAALSAIGKFGCSGVFMGFMCMLTPALDVAHMSSLLLHT
jgi:MFS family permease